MSCRSHNADGHDMPAIDDDYVIERPRLVLAMLDLMEKFEREPRMIRDSEETPHAP